MKTNETYCFNVPDGMEVYVDEYIDSTLFTLENSDEILLRCKDCSYVFFQMLIDFFVANMEVEE